MKKSIISIINILGTLDRGTAKELYLYHLLRHPTTPHVWLICNLFLSSAATSSSARTRNILRRQSFPELAIQSILFNQSLSINLFQSAPWDCSENTVKAGALGHRERQSDRRKLLSATMSPMAVSTPPTPYCDINYRYLFLRKK